MVNNHAWKCCVIWNRNNLLFLTQDFAQNNVRQYQRQRSNISRENITLVFSHRMCLFFNNIFMFVFFSKCCILNQILVSGYRLVYTLNTCTRLSTCIHTQILKNTVTTHWSLSTYGLPPGMLRPLVLATGALGCWCPSKAIWKKVNSSCIKINKQEIATYKLEYYIDRNLN